jgi:hypothetical protein
MRVLQVYCLMQGSNTRGVDLPHFQVYLNRHNPYLARMARSIFDTLDKVRPSGQCCRLLAAWGSSCKHTDSSDSGPGDMMEPLSDAAIRPAVSASTLGCCHAYNPV